MIQLVLFKPLSAKLSRIVSTCLSLCVFFSFSYQLNAQSIELGIAKSNLKYDTSYIEAFPDHISGRLYLSRKFTDISFVEQEEKRGIHYRPNTTLNLGIGATVRGFTLNLAYGFRFLNQNETIGKTEYLDLQSHMYGRKHVIDFYGQLYSGLYLENTTDLFPEMTEQSYLRPDLRIVILGATYFRVFNDRKFSYSASLVQNEFQKKSAGSFLLGAKAFVMAAGSDSSMIPVFDRDSMFNAFIGVDRLRTYQFGPGVGYAHTFIMWERFFLTLSFDVNFMIGNSRYRIADEGVTEEWQVNTSMDLRLALGYNSEKSYFGLSYVEDTKQMRSEDGNINTFFGVGNIRLNYVRRFEMGSKTKEVIDKYLP